MVNSPYSNEPPRKGNSIPIWPFLLAAGVIGFGVLVVVIIAATRLAPNSFSLGARTVDAPDGSIVNGPVLQTADTSLVSDVPDAYKQFIHGKLPGALSLRTSGPGVVVCDPAVDATAKGDENFGFGVSAWMQLAAAGQSEFGQTPLWHSFERARVEMGRPNLEIADADAPALAQTLGVTDVVTGTMSQAGSVLTINYKVLSEPTNAQIGKTVTLSGTQDQLVAQLPSAATQVDGILGVSKPTLPPVACAVTDLAAIGSARWQPNLGGRETVQLASLANTVPLAAVVDLDHTKLYSASSATACAQNLIKLLPNSPVGVGDLAMTFQRALPTIEPQIDALYAAYPGNYQLAFATCRADRERNDLRSSVIAAESAVKSAPINPDAWQTLAVTYGLIGDSVREGRFPSGLTTKQWGDLTVDYGYWLGAAERAALLDANDGYAYWETAEAASFAGKEDEADAAMRHALHLKYDIADSYDWALQTYQAKWLGQSAKFDAVISLLATDPSVTPYQQITVYHRIRKSPYTAEANTLANSIAKSLQARIAANPNDAQAYAGLGYLYFELERWLAARRELKESVLLDPSDPEVHYKLGDACYNGGRLAEAVEQHTIVVNMVPDYPNVHYRLGWALKSLKRYKEAQAQMQTELRYYPNSSDGHFGSATVYELQSEYAPAISEFKKSLDVVPDFLQGWRSLINCLDEDKQYDEALRQYEVAKTYFPDDDNMMTTIADVYLNKSEPDNSIRYSERVLGVSQDTELLAIAHLNLAEAYNEKRDFAKENEELKLTYAYGLADINRDARDFVAKHPLS